MTKSKNSIRKFLIVVLMVVMSVTLVFAVACKKPNKNSGSSDSEQPSATQSSLPAPSLKSIKVTKTPDKQDYFSFESFDPAGMEITAVYTDKSEKSVSVSECEFSTDVLVPGTNQVMISYNGKSTSVDVSVSNKTFEEQPNLWIEAENADVHGYTSEKNAAIPELTCRNIKYNVDGAHGGACLYNLANIGNTIAFTFNSDKALVGDLKISVAARKKTSALVSNWYKVTANDDVVASSEYIGAPEDETDYFTFYTVSTNIRIKEGANTVVLTVKDTPGNLDAIGIVAPGANITDTTVASLAHNDPGWRVSVVPTDATEGTAEKGCTVCGSFGESMNLPVLNDKDYTIETLKEATAEENGLAKYTYAIDNQNTVSFEVKTYYVSLTTNVYTFEAESAALSGKSASGDNKDKALDCRNLRSVEYCIENIDGFDPATIFSGNEIVFAINKTGNTVTYVISSDMAVEALLTVRVGVRVESGKAVEVTFNKMFTVTVNGGDIQIPETVVVTPDSSSSTAYEFHTVSLGKIQLEQGENTLVFTVPSAQKAGNLDYIQLTTVATLENKSVPMSHGETGWLLVETPTEENTGLLIKGCLVCGKLVASEDSATAEQKYILPVISVKEDFYTGSGVNYVATVDGQTFNFVGPDRAAQIAFAGEHRWLGSYKAENGGALVDFYNTASWGGTAPTVEEDGSLKFTSLARIDRQLFVDGTSLLPSSNDAANDEVMDKPVTYSMQIKSSGNFNVLLYAGSDATAGNSGSISKYSLQLNYDAATRKFSWTRRTSKTPSVGTISVETTFNADDWNVIDIVVTRSVKGEEGNTTTVFTVDLYLNGYLVKFTKTSASTTDDFVDEKGSSYFCVSKNLTGGYLVFSPVSDATLYIKTPADSHYKGPVEEGQDA